MTSFSHDMMTGGRGGSGYPPKVMTSFMNSPLLVRRTQSIDDEDDDDEGAGKAASFRVMNKVCIKNVI